MPPYASVCTIIDNKGDFNCTTTLANASNTIPVYNGFSGGDIIISFFLFLIVIVITYASMWFMTRGVKIRQ